MHIEYRPKGVCSQLMSIDVEDGKIEKVEVKGGCSGNLQGISALLVLHGWSSFAGSTLSPA